mmetsp:Transcript_11815/g.13369  ORF Transcript_11815/g.13369 Transcript_11815/m.13369 type:complete len:99 (+) Transcript_11815:542-838(+)
MNFNSTDNPRTLEDIDRMVSSMNYLSKKLGEEKSKAIEYDPELFYNGNKFRFYQANAYHRSIVTTFLAMTGGVFLVGGYKKSNSILNKYKYPLLIGTA